MSNYRDALAAVAPRDTFMERVRRTLTTHGVTHAALAREIGVCPTQLSRWLRGRKQPSLESMLKIDEALNAVLYGGN